MRYRLSHILYFFWGLSIIELSLLLKYRSLTCVSTFQNKCKLIKQLISGIRDSEIGKINEKRDAETEIMRK